MLQINHENKNVTAVFAMVESVVDLYCPEQRSKRLFRLFRTSARKQPTKALMAQRVARLEHITKLMPLPIYIELVRQAKIYLNEL